MPRRPTGAVDGGRMVAAAPRRLRQFRAGAAAVTLAALAACSRAPTSPVVPGPAFTGGTFVLVAVDSAPLPVLIGATNSTRIFVGRDTLELHPDGSCRERQWNLVYPAFENGGPSTSESTSACSWRAAGAQVSLTFGGGTTSEPGAADANGMLTINRPWAGSAGRWTFQPVGVQRGAA